MSLQITKEERENRQLVLTIQVDQDRVDQELRKAARKFAGNYRFPGFRKGKAPYHVVAQQVGLPALYNEFLEKLGETVYKEALEQEQLEPYARAALEDVQIEPVTYKLAMPLEPVIDLGDYRALRVEETTPTVDEAEVDARLEQYRDQHANWVDIDRPSQYGDKMNINLRSVLIPDAGETVEAEEASVEETVILNETDWDVTPDQENPMEPAGLDEELLGLRPGDEKEFDLTWPTDSKSMYAGQRAHFTVKVNHIQAYEKPELTDEFAQLVGPDFTTLEDLEASIRTTLQERAQAQADSEYLGRVLDALVAQSTMNYPPIVVEDQIDSMLADMEMQLRRFGIESLDSYFQQTGQKLEDVRESLRPDATTQALRNLAISELLRLEALTVNDEEIETRISAMTAGADEETAQQLAATFRNESARMILESQVLRDKAVERLLAIARGQGDATPAAENTAEAETAETEVADAADANATPDAAPTAETTETPAATEESTTQEG
ncbi:MAG: trigger factor [Caldilineaceae bacterium]